MPQSLPFPPLTAGPRRKRWWKVGIVAAALLAIFFFPATVLSPGRLKTKVWSEMATILRVAELRRDVTGSYPASIREMVNPVGPNGEPLAALEYFPRDSWGREYIYELIGGSPRMRCLGSDGVEGGQGDAADIVLPEPSAE